MILEITNVILQLGHLCLQLLNGVISSLALATKVPTLFGKELDGAPSL
jgi:hypothetical protein